MNVVLTYSALQITEAAPDPFDLGGVPPMLLRREVDDPARAEELLVRRDQLVCASAKVARAEPRPVDRLQVGVDVVGVVRRLEIRMTIREQEIYTELFDAMERRNDHDDLGHRESLDALIAGLDVEEHWCTR